MANAGAPALTWVWGEAPARFRAHGGWSGKTPQAESPFKTVSKYVLKFTKSSMIQRFGAMP